MGQTFRSTRRSAWVPAGQVQTARGGRQVHLPGPPVRGPGQDPHHRRHHAAQRGRLCPALGLVVCARLRHHDLRPRDGSRLRGVADGRSGLRPHFHPRFRSPDPPEARGPLRLG